jgi:hypothetical protein
VIGSIPIEGNGIQMSFTPWKEAAFISTSSTSAASHVLHTPSTSNKNTTNSNPKNTSFNAAITNFDPKNTNFNPKNAKNNPINTKLNPNNATTDMSFDKRFILKVLQKQGSLDFLRKHKLNGSEELVLKKRNKGIYMFVWVYIYLCI